MSRDKRSRSRSLNNEQAQLLNANQVDPDIVIEMCNDRQACRRKRIFERADALQQEIIRMGVRMDDTNCTWSSACGQMGTFAPFSEQPKLDFRFAPVPWYDFFLSLLGLFIVPDLRPCYTFSSGIIYSKKTK